MAGANRQRKSSQPSELHRAPEIAPAEIILGDLIGEGSFGKVYRGKCRGKDVAIKRLHRPITDDKVLNDFRREVNTMASFQHPNICLFMGACTQPGSFFIVSEYLPNGDVESLLHDKNKKVSVFRRLLMAKDAAMGMNWLHCSNPAFIHRDLKTSNLLIDENGRVKVCDFGLSEAKEQGAMLRDRDRAMGTPLWMAPEVMMFKPFSEKVDIYSFGIVLWEIVTRQPPFPHHTDYTVFRDAVCNKHERPPIPKGLDPSLADLMQRCWHPDPAQRPSFERILAELDHILVHVAITDQLGRAFWKHHFLGEAEVAWLTFIQFFCEALRHPVHPDDVVDSPYERERVRWNIECMKALLATAPHGPGQDETVDCERFGEILDWFGPIGHPDQTPPGETILDHIREVLRQPWFHGDLDEAKATARLAGKPANTFLVRFSSQRGFFTISQIHPQQKTVKHWRIEHHANSGFVLEGQSYPSLFALLESKGLLSKKSFACEGSRFQYIFKGDTADGGYVNRADQDDVFDIGDDGMDATMI